MFEYGAGGKGIAFKGSNVAWPGQLQMRCPSPLTSILDIIVCSMAIQQLFVVYFTRDAVFSMFEYHRSWGQRECF